MDECKFVFIYRSFICVGYCFVFFFILFSVRMMWVGFYVKYNKLEVRSYFFWIKDIDDNNFIR